MAFTKKDKNPIQNFVGKKQNIKVFLPFAQMKMQKRLFCITKILFLFFVFCIYVELFTMRKQ